MNDLIDYYQQQISATYSTHAWLKKLQEDACGKLIDLGFPTRMHEDWKYTSVDALLQERFVKGQAKPHHPSHHDLPFKLKISILSGHVHGINALQAYLPKGVLVLTLKDALLHHPDKVQPYLGAILKTEHGFHALNTAMLEDGVFIYVPKSIIMDEPIVLSHWQEGEQQASFLRHLVVMEEGSAFTLIEDYAGGEGCYFTNSVTEVHLQKQAALTHYKVQRENKRAYHIAHVAVKQKKDSQFNSHSLSFGGKTVRSDITIDLEEQGASCLMNGLYVPGEGQHMDHHTVVNHLSPHCQSTQDYKGILMGHSRAVFNGQVMVAQHAQHTVAKQQNKNLLLSTSAEIDTKPELRIFANDVVCTHGATVGQLDEDALFYLATRGIDRATACEYLIGAFTIENFRALQNDVLQVWVSAVLAEQLRGAHACHS